MKKQTSIILSILGSIAIVLPLFFIIFTYGTVKGGVAFFSNRPSYKSDGFNSSTFYAAENYEKYMQSDSGYSQPNKNIIITETKAYDDTGKKYVEEIAKLYDKGYRTAISSGFQVAQTYTGGVSTDKNKSAWGGLFEDKNKNLVELYKDKFVVLLDDSVLASKYKNAVSVSFAAEGAGFAAGIGSAIYTQYDSIEKIKENPKYTPNIVMWGGMPYPTVYNFMSGFAQAIELINDMYKDNNTYNEIVLWSGGGLSDKKILPSNTYGTSNLGTWYTNGFDGSTNTQVGKDALMKTENALNEKASIIFPIAGANSNIVVQKMKDVKERNTKLVGVDSDATFEFGENDEAELIIGSATKSMALAGKLGLWAIDDYDNNKILNFKDPVKNDSMYINGGKDFITNVKESEKGWYVSEYPNPEVPEKPKKPKGYQFSGTLSNKGVGFNVINLNNGEGAEGMNLYLKKAISKLFKNGEQLTDEMAEKILNEQIQFISEKLGDEAIKFEDSEFTPGLKD